MAVVAVVCAAALAVAGGVGCKAWSDHETAVAARDCRSASEAYRKAVDSYNGLVDGDAATASRIIAKQVKDTTTVDGLACVCSIEVRPMRRNHSVRKSGRN